MTIEFANRLAELRKEKGYSQEDLAGKLGVSRQAISKWERGEATPDSDNLIALSSLYGVSLDELVHQKRGEGKVLDDKTEYDEEKEDSEEKEPETEREEEEMDPRIKRLRLIEGIVIPSLALVITLVYVVTGCLLDAAMPDPWVWKIGWVFYLLLPAVSSSFAFARTKNYELISGILTPLVVMTYIFLGMLGGYWHPSWVVFLLIPVFWGVFGAINKKASK